MNTCFLFIKYLQAESCLSLLMNADGLIKGPLAQRSFLELIQLQRSARTIVVAPSDHFSIYQIEIPLLSDKKARAAIPFALEDKLAQNINDLHFAFDRAHYVNGQYNVLVTDKAYLRELIDKLQTAGVHWDALTIDWFALDAKEIAMMPEYLLINEAYFKGALGFELTNFYLTRITQPQHFYFFSDSPINKINILPSLQKFDIQEPSLIWVSRRLLNKSFINLDQGEFEQSTTQTSTRRWYFAAIAMTALWLSSLLIANWIKLYQLNRATVNVDKKIATIYREFFPQAKQVISPKFRIAQLLKLSRQNQDLSFWLLLNSFAKIFQEKQIKVEQLRFQNKVLQITVIAESFEQLEALQNNLLREKIQVKQLQATTRENQAVSTLELSL